MDCVGEPQKKIFKARKTMRSSDRQQLEAVHKARDEILKPGGGAAGGGEQGAREGPDTPPLLNGKHSPENQDSPPHPSPTPPSSPSPPPPHSSTPRSSSPEERGGVAPAAPGTEREGQAGCAEESAEIYEDISEPSPAEAGPSEGGDSGCADSLTDTQTPGQTDGQPSVEMDTPPSAETDTQSPGQTDGQLSVETDTQTDGQPSAETDTQTLGQTDGQQPSVETDGQPCTAKDMEMEGEREEEEEEEEGGLEESPSPPPDITPACAPAEREGSPSPTPREENREPTISSSMEIALPSPAPPSPTPGTPQEEGSPSPPDSPLPPAQPGSPKLGEEPEKSASPLKTTPEEPASPSEASIIPILEKLGQLAPSPSPPPSLGSSPSPAPSRHDSCDLIPREGFLVLSEEEEGGGERERVDDNEAAALAPPGGDSDVTAAGSGGDIERERGGEPQNEGDDPAASSSQDSMEVDPSPLLHPPSSSSSSSPPLRSQRKRFLSGGDAHSYPSPWELKRPRRCLQGGEQCEEELELKITTGREELQHKLEKIVQRILEEKIQALQCGEFDKTMKQLRERVERIDCRDKHETVLTALQAKISRLSKRFGAANKAREEEKKAQELSVVAAAAAPTTTTYRSPQTVLLVRTTSSKNATVNDVLTYASKNISVRKMLETRRTDIQTQPNPPETAPSPISSPAHNAVQFKPLSMATTTSSPSATVTAVTPLLQAAPAGTQLSSMGTVSLNLSQAPPTAAGNLATANQTTATAFSLPLILHVPMAVSSSSPSSSSQAQFITAGVGRGQTAPPSSSSSSSSSISYSTPTSSFELTPVPASSFPVPTPQSRPQLQPAVSQPKPFPPTSLGPPRAAQGSLAQGCVPNRAPLVASGLYGAPAGVGVSAGPRGPTQHGRSQTGALLVSQAGAESHSTIGSSSNAALERAENQTINRAADSTTLKTPTQVVRSAVIDLTEDDDDVQVTGVRKAPPALNQAPPSSSLLSRPLTTAPSAPAGGTLQPTTTTMHVLPTAQTTVNVLQRPPLSQLRPASGPWTPLSSQGVFTPQLPSTPGGGNSRAVSVQQGQHRQGSPQSTGLPVRANPQSSPYALNGPQLTVHHRGPQEAPPPPPPPPAPRLLPLHPAPLPDPPAPPRLSPEALATSPPQRPQLKLARVQSQNGIVLSWTVDRIDEKCAAVDSYHLYAYHQDSSSSSSSSAPPSSQWKKIGEVKALPLPMACTLTQFVSGSKYYFAVRGKDIYGRFGAFCEPQSTDVIATQQPGS